MSELKVVTKSKLSKTDKSSLFGWGDNLWDNDKYALTWRPADCYFVGYVDQMAVTNSGAVLHTIDVDGQELSLGGLNTVITIPEARGKGYAGVVVGAAEDHMRQVMKVDFGMLFCHPELVPFYQPRGWRSTEGPVTIDQPDGPRETPHIVMVMPFTQTVWPDVPLKLNSLPW